MSDGYVYRGKACSDLAWKCKNFNKGRIKKLKEMKNMNKKILIIIIIILILGVFVSMKWKDIYYEGISWIAVFRQNPSICDKIKDEVKKDSCYFGVAEYKPDPFICDKIKNQEQKDSCYAKITIYSHHIPQSH